MRKKSLQHQKQLLEDSRLASGENQLDLDASTELIDLEVQTFGEINRIDSGEESTTIFRNMPNYEKKIRIVQNSANDCSFGQCFAITTRKGG
jgi:hypothetical protein